MTVSQIIAKEMSIDSANQIIFESLGMCECGDPETVLEFVKEAMEGYNEN